MAWCVDAQAPPKHTTGVCMPKLGGGDLCLSQNGYG
eukprot:CAMPEP_0113996588 /NCGR_PEP_ID=MMETSP0328-20130328/11830_1 /TAXON_ID=39455 /ORGANISM="Alexandrium minutum" /LENGTH=35 /assembly_acc=CAM_ASM_000350